MSTDAQPTERPLDPGTLVIADLHLDLAAEEPPQGFLDWLDSLDDGVPELLVLGDLFDFWVGPAQAQLPAARAVLDALADRVRRGMRLSVIPGNRDFLLGGSFLEQTGGGLFPSGVIGTHAGARQRSLWIHGDELCTRDTGYQRLRTVLRSRAVGWLSRHLPLKAGLWIARRLRRASTRALAVKPAPEKAMQAAACRDRAAAAGSEVVVCGHAHQFRDLRLAGGTRGGDPAVRWVVLDAFGGPRDCVRVGGGGQLEIGSSRVLAGDSGAMERTQVVDPA